MSGRLLQSKTQGAFVITDRLLGTQRMAEVVLQLAPGLPARREVQRDTGEVLGEAAKVIMEIAFPAGMVSARSGGDAPGAGGWVSPRFGLKVPAARLSWRGEVGEAGVVTRLMPRRAI